MAPKYYIHPHIDSVACQLDSGDIGYAKYVEDAQLIAALMPVAKEIGEEWKPLEPEKLSIFSRPKEG